MQILIIEDHPLYRDALARLATRLFDDVSLLQAESFTAAEARLAAEPHCDLVLLDLGLPDVHGLTAISRLRQISGTLRIVVVSASEDRTLAERCLQEAAHGYVPKSATTAAIGAALRAVMEGGTSLPPMCGVAGEAARSVMSTVAPAAALSPRELEVLSMVCAGHANKEIARALAIAESTVRAHLTAIFRAFGVVNRTQAAREARVRGLVKD